MLSGPVEFELQGLHLRADYVHHDLAEDGDAGGYDGEGWLDVVPDETGHGVHWFLIIFMLVLRVCVCFPFHFHFWLKSWDLWPWLASIAAGELTWLMLYRSTKKLQ